MRISPVLKLGYKASAEQFAPGKLLDFSVHAEKAGFESVFVSDHFQPWKHIDGHAPNSLAWLGALGARTAKVAIGTSVLTPTFRYHPSIVAQAFGTLGSMFPGRVILGIGTGGVFAWVARSAPPKQVGSVTGIVGAAGGLGGFVPPLLMGATYDGAGNDYTIGLLLLSLTCLAALAYTAWRMPRDPANRSTVTPTSRISE